MGEGLAEEVESKMRSEAGRRSSQSVTEEAVKEDGSASQAGDRRRKEGRCPKYEKGTSSQFVLTTDSI